MGLCKLVTSSAKSTHMYVALFFVVGLCVLCLSLLTGVLEPEGNAKIMSTGGNGSSSDRR